ESWQPATLCGGRRSFARAPHRPRSARTIVRAERTLVTLLARGLGVDRLLHAAAGNDRFGDPRREQPNRTHRIVVAGDDEVDFVGIAVGVDDADHGNLELARLVDRNLLFLGVDDEDRVGQPRHAADALEVLLQLAPLLLVAGDFLLG